MEQALLPPGSRDFESSAEQARFLKDRFAQPNAAWRARPAEEMAVMLELPGRRMESLPRLRVRSKYRIEYRHIIEGLVRKPGAFENCRYQEYVFPTSRFGMAHDGRRETVPGRPAKEHLKIPKLAVEEGEVQVDEAIRELPGGKAEAAITAESIGELPTRPDTVAPVRLVEVAPGIVVDQEKQWTLDRRPAGDQAGPPK